MAIALLPLLMFLPHIFRPMFVGDNIIEFIPHYRYIFSMIRSFHDPLWNPYLFCGFPMSGYASATPYEILSWVHLFLPATAAGNLHITLIYSVAGIGFYLFGRAAGLSRRAAFLTGMLYSTAGYTLSAFASVLALSGAPWTGWTLAALEMLRKSRGFRERSKWTLLFASASALLLVSGHPSTFMHTCVFMGMYCLIVGLFGGEKKHGMIWIGCAGVGLIIAGLLGSAVTLPSMELQQLSWRKTLPFEVFVGKAYTPAELLSGIVFIGTAPRESRVIYMGIIPLLLAGFGVIYRFKDIRIKAFTLIALISAILTLGTTTFLPDILYHVPFLNLLGHFRRYRIELCSALAILAGSGLDSILLSGSIRRPRWILSIAAISLVGACAAFIGGFFNGWMIFSGVVSAGAVFALLYLYMHKRANILLGVAALVFIVHPALLISEYLKGDEDKLDPEQPSPILEYVAHQTGREMPPPRALLLVDIAKHTMRFCYRVGAQNISENQLIHNAAGYNPLLSERFYRLMNMDYLGFPARFREIIEPPAIIPDLLNVEYIVLPKEYLKKFNWRLFTFPDILKIDNVPFIEEFYLKVLPKERITFNVPNASIKGIGLITAITEAPETPHGADVLKVVLWEQGGVSQETILKAGIDTAEAAYSILNKPAKFTFVKNGVQFYEPINIILKSDNTYANIFPRPHSAKGIAIISAIINGEDIKQGAAVATINIYTKDGAILSVPIRAGVETADWSIVGRSDAAHNSIEAANEIRMPDGASGISYFSRIDFNNPVDVEHLEISMTDKNMPIAFLITNMSFIGESGVVIPVTPQTPPRHNIANIIKDRKIDDRSGNYNLYYTIKYFDRNINVNSCSLQSLMPTGKVSVRAVTLIDDKNEDSIPLTYFDHILGNSSLYEKRETPDAYVWRKISKTHRAWLAGGAMLLKPDEILSALQKGVLPDGGNFDLWNVALFDEPTNVPPPAGTPARGDAAFIEYLPNVIKLKAECDRRCVLVVSETWYPGWKAWVDGKETQIFRADYVLRGVMLDAGSHVVEMRYQPASVRIGRAISLITMMTMAAFWIVVRARFTD